MTAAELNEALGAEIAGLPAYRLVIVEGELRADLSDLAGLKAAGVEVVSLTEALTEAAALAEGPCSARSMRRTAIRSWH